MMGRKLTREQLDQVVDLMSKGASKTKAAQLAGTTRRSINHRASWDEKFAERLQEAEQAQIDHVRDQVWKLAIEGTQDFRLDRDGNEHPFVVYSERMLELMAKSVVPEYQDRQHIEISGRGRLEVTVEHDFPEIAAVLEGIGLLPGGARAVLDAAPLALQPARTDTEADGGADRAPAAAD